MSEATCKDYAEITDLRASDPGAIARAWQGRAARPAVRGNGRLMIVAADHPARGALAVGSLPTAMNSRTDLLDRLRAALATKQRFGISYWDACVLEAARSLGCEVVLSEDLSSETDYAGVRVENPFM